MPEHYGDYDVESFLGKGSIGKVYLARHRRIGRRVALKTVILDQKFEDEDDRSEFFKRLQREAELCASMQHPNIVSLYEVGYEGDVVSWLATEYVDGESLLARLRRVRLMPVDDALRLASDLLRGLAYAHSKGIIHRDIKPANILLTSAGDAKIADFGVARPLHSSLTATRSLVGTPNYMSPEQVKTTPVSPRSDLFSAGVVLYELLTGSKPFAAPELSGILYNVVNHVPIPASAVNPDVPDDVAVVVAKLMAKAPQDRFATAEEALAEIEKVRERRLVQAAGDPTISVRPDDSSTPAQTIVEDSGTPILRRPVPALLFWIVTALLSVSLAASVFQLRRSISAQKPAGIITREQAAEAAAKVKALTSIRALTAAGEYEAAIRGYDEYLVRYPHSAVAESERAEAQKLLEESAPKAEVTKVAKRPRRPRETEPEKKPGRWERVKRWFRGE